MRRIVLDASIVVALYVEEAITAPAREVLTKVDEIGAELHAPDLLLVETANALWKRVGREELSHEEARTAIDSLSSLEDLNLHPMDGRIVRQALLLAFGHRLTAYDATYVALTLSLSDGVLVSGDRRLVKRSRDAGFPVLGPGDLVKSL